ncbi:uncharacterized protein LOC122668661 [Telopea speciosissima]|uniref:uncharacterized protein LOC122668661 n=1 Tax=Telopea speciosissima TaxID=54955 RepID=UPI001CC35B96|nr:uncharacterized protein LOC122668661 [Telopea speciosissima]
MSILISSLSDEAMSLAVGRATSKELWDALHAAYSNASTPRILSINAALQQLVQKPDETVTQFLSRAKALSDDLSAAGKPLPPEDLYLHIFYALLAEFQPLVPTIMDRQEPISYTDMYGLLVSHEYLLQSRQAVVDPAANATANMTQYNRGTPT